MGRRGDEHRPCCVWVDLTFSRPVNRFTASESSRELAKGYINSLQFPLERNHKLIFQSIQFITSLNTPDLRVLSPKQNAAHQRSHPSRHARRHDHCASQPRDRRACHFGSQKQHFAHRTSATFQLLGHADLDRHQLPGNSSLLDSA